MEGCTKSCYGVTACSGVCQSCAGCAWDCNFWTYNGSTCGTAHCGWQACNGDCSQGHAGCAASCNSGCSGIYFI